MISRGGKPSDFPGRNWAKVDPISGPFPTLQQKVSVRFHLLVTTLPETNSSPPKNGWLEYYFPIGEAYFQVRTVSFREGIHAVDSW